MMCCTTADEGERQPIVHVCRSILEHSEMMQCWAIFGTNSSSSSSLYMPWCCFGVPSFVKQMHFYFLPVNSRFLHGFDSIVL